MEVTTRESPDDSKCSRNRPTPLREIAMITDRRDIP